MAHSPDSTAQYKPGTGRSLFALAFRPFFLAAGAAAVGLMLLWLWMLHGAVDMPTYLSASLWHAHEMIFGFLAAVIVGFLLTAVRTWTGLPGLSGWPLALLALLWLLGRLLLASAPLQLYPLVALIDLAFVPVAAVILGISVIKVKQWRNAIFLPILTLFFIANLLVHLQALGLTSTASLGLSMGLWLVLLLIIILGGRVLPMFTSNGLGGVKVSDNRLVNIGSIVSFILLAISDLLQAEALLPWLALVCVVFHGLRLLGWRCFLTWRTPLLWVLHIGYAWLIAGFILVALQEMLALPRTVPMHAFAVGTIGNFVIGMMSRVALGHTGRTLQAARIMTLAYVAVNLAAFVRVILPLLLPLDQATLILVAGLLWILGYGIFIIVYLPILGRPRVDGKPG